MVLLPTHHTPGYHLLGTATSMATWRKISETIKLLPYSLEPCDQLTSGQEDLGCCLFSSLTIQKQNQIK